MSTADQAHSSRIHGEALVAAERLMDNPALDPLLRRLAEVTVNPQDRAQAAGTLAGQTFAHLPHGGGDLGYYDKLGAAVQVAYDQASAEME